MTFTFPPPLKSKLSLALRGFFMGAADVVPGVSGGTIAYITGIYPQLIGALATFGRGWFSDMLSFNKTRTKHALKAVPYDFILPLFVGIIGALVLFVWCLSLGEMVAAHPLPFGGVFFGFVGMSALFLLRRYGSTCPRLMLFVLAGYLAAAKGATLIPVTTPDTPWVVFLSGMLAISAMVLPGVSGALVLVVLGQYRYILTSLKELDLAVILPFIGGIVLGLLLFGHGLNWLMQHFYRQTMLVMVGLLLGSLHALWPFGSMTANSDNIAVFSLFAALGSAVIVVLHVWEGLLKKDGGS